MMPDKSDSIKNLFVSCTENGVQDQISLLATYKFFNEVLKTKGIKKPVVLLSDGHTSRFDFEVLKFLYENEIFLFVPPPDKTGVTQLLQQINHALYDTYRQKNKEQYLSNRKGFVNILSDIWSTWTTKDTIINAAKIIGISSAGVSVEWMQQEKFEPEPVQSTASNITSSASLKPGSLEYYKFKYEEAMSIINKISENAKNLEAAKDFKFLQN